jgi:acetate kinase
MALDPQPILSINSGSSTLKFGLFVESDAEIIREERPLLMGGAEGIGKDSGKLEILDGDGKTLHSEEKKYASQNEALQHITSSLGSLGVPRPIAVGHRIVHGGPHLVDHTRITPEVLETLQSAIHFAPLHIPTSLELIRDTETVYPDLPQFACFDTAFHQTLPEIAYHYALPEKFLEQGVRRYGFHGLSYASIVHQLGRDLKPRTVVAHLGSGSSLTALHGGESVDTSMGLTPTGGIPMGTRTGDLDPGVLLFLLRAGKLTTDSIEALLNHQSGLLALGGTSDMRELQKAASSGEHKAALAIDIFCTAIAKTIAAFSISLEGLDQLVFAGGIGEHSPEIRAAVTARLAILGVDLDADRNSASASILSANTSRVEVRIIPSREEIQIAREVRARL